MPVGRIILKSISQSKKLSLLKSHGARLLYTWLIPHLDKNGNFYAEPDIIKGLIFSRLKDSERKISEYLDDLDNNGLIIKYKVNEDVYLTVPDFAEKQPNLNIEREGKTPIPMFNQDLIMNKSGVTQIKSSLNKSKLNQINSNENIESFENEFENLWKAYHIDGKKNKAYAKTRFIALCKNGKLDDFKKGFEGYANFLEFKEKKENFNQRPKYFSTLCTDYEEYIKYFGHKVKADL